MSQKIALIICANPANREQPSVYISDGKWVPDISEVGNSAMQIFIEDPIFSENWKMYSLVDGMIEGPGNFMVCFTKNGGEKNITIMLEKKED
jgi:hypothetical protein